MSPKDGGARASHVIFAARAPPHPIDTIYYTQ